jgi:hypothetical protein
MSFNLSITDKPTHVVVWTDNSNVSELVKTLTERVASLEATVSKLMNTGMLSGIEMRRREDSISAIHESDSKDLFKELIDKTHVSVAKQAEEAVDAEVDAEEVEIDAEVEEEVEEEVDAEDAEGTEEAEKDAEGTEDAEVEEEEVEEEAEEALELDEFEYKGVTYFKDTENQVYQVGADGDLDDTPIGVWNEEKQKVLKYAKA